jgi:hypothetical protein
MTQDAYKRAKDSAVEVLVRTSFAGTLLEYETDGDEVRDLVGIVKKPNRNWVINKDGGCVATRLASTKNSSAGEWRFRGQGTARW